MTIRADVLVIGAGPAGSAAATVLAEGGASVVLADRAQFPRDKICGDALLPDALRALAALGVGERVAAAAQRVPHLEMRAASGRSIRFELDSAVVPRMALDEALVDRAREAGAEVLTGASLTGLERADGRFRAARLETGGDGVTVEARAFVLATGAAARPRELAGLVRRRTLGAAALRGYAEVTGFGDDALLIALLGELSRGYAWAFPGPQRSWNVGCGVFAHARPAVGLRAAADRFLAALGGRWQSEPRGAALLPVYPALPVVHRNLVAAGEAAGLTRPFTGEGIGPALDSGMLAARCLLGSPDASGARGYARALRQRFAADFRAFRFGELFLRLPRLVDLIIARAARLPGAQRRCTAVLAGEMPASRVLSPLGLLRLILGR